MRPILLRRYFIAVVILVLLLTLAACEKPLQEEETPTPETPAETVPEGQEPGDGTTAPEAVQTPSEGTEPGGEAPAGEQPTEESGEQPSDGTGEQPAGEGDTQPVEGDQPSADVTYVVQAGDTLALIAQRYSVTVEEIAAANGIVDVNTLEVGTTLIIPTGSEGTQVTEPAQPTQEPAVVATTVPTQPGVEQVHIVQAGENLFRIGLRYGCTVAELSAYNGIANPNYINVGQAIRIPATCGG